MSKATVIESTSDSPLWGRDARDSTRRVLYFDIRLDLNATLLRRNHVYHLLSSSDYRGFSSDLHTAHAVGGENSAELCEADVIKSIRLLTSTARWAASTYMHRQPFVVIQEGVLCERLAWEVIRNLRKDYPRADISYRAPSDEDYSEYLRLVGVLAVQHPKELFGDYAWLVLPDEQENPMAHNEVIEHAQRTCNT